MENENLLASDVEYLKECLRAVEQYKKLELEQEQYETSVIQLEREIEREEKAFKEEKDMTIQSRKEEIAASFDKEIRKDQDKIRKIKSDRDKAKNKGIAGRIEAETQDIRNENRQIHMEIRGILKEHHLPGFCRYHAYYVLFYPKGVEYLVLLAVMAICLMALPYGIFFLIPSQKPLYMLIISFLCSVIFFFLYQIISNHTRASKWEAVRHIRALRDKIRANNKKIRAIRNAVEKDKDEEGYNLESYDQEIFSLEAEVKKTLAEKQEALNVFEDTTRHILEEEIRIRVQPKLDSLSEEHQQVSKELKSSEQAAKDLNKHITSTYEAFLGKEYVNEESIQEMIELMEEEHIATVAQALVLYKEER